MPVSPIGGRLRDLTNNSNGLSIGKMTSAQTGGSGHQRELTAVVYCEANFGAIDGKTANGLVRHSEKYRIVAVIDSEKNGLDSGVVLGE